MKTTTLFQGIIMVLTAAAAAETKAPAMRDAATHEQLALALRKADQMDPMKNLPAAKGEDPSVANRPKDLLSQSDIISFRGLATLVPKRAILQIPKSCEERIKLEPGAKIVSWADFYAANRGWISTVEVSRVQAEGNKPLAEDSQKLLSTSRNLVVATYQGGPISVLPLKVPEENSKDAPAQTANAKQVP
jgi:hypothetical protein